MSISQPWVDAAGHHTRRLTLSVDSVRRLPTRVSTTLGTPQRMAVVPSERDGIREVAVPTGAVGWDVTMTVKADPGQVLQGCTVAVIDSRGREFTSSNLAGVEPVSAIKPVPCAPDDHPGPSAVVVAGHPQDAERLGRPAAYTTHAVVVTAADAEPRTVRVWWDYPLAVEVAVRASG